MQSHHRKVSLAAPAPPPASHAFEKKPEFSESHPFGQELAQVTEIAEEFGQKLGPIERRSRSL